MDAADVILRPVVSEKSFELARDYRYTFEVSPRANKVQIRHAVEELFGVHVISVNTMWVRGKSRRLGRMSPGRTPSWKKAVVTTREGEHIAAFDTD
ncbi:MAG TPA: 50S ribosomal protein L23 [Armatimonadetes bacterium]|nr:50S ribosomal protein L23 [Armatimonadota bacterium]